MAFRLRYSISFKGVENLTPENLHKPGGILFLPNHPSQLDGIIAVWALEKFHPRPAAVEYLYQIPGVRFLLNLVNSIPVPNIDLCSNNLKRDRVNKAMDNIIACLKNKENFLFYPAGRMKLTGVEMIGGASGLHRILHEAPETNVVLIRMNGLWGSSFSRALTGSTPFLGKTLWQGFKHILKNLIFFTPRRKVVIEFFPNPKDFPYQSSRLVTNHYLEDFYNQAPEGSSRETQGEPLTRVSYSMWKEVLPPLPEPPKEESEISIEKIPKAIRENVLHEIANLANKSPKEISFETHLASDLGLDSLDATELLIFLEDHYQVTGLYPSDLTTVASIMAIAAKQKIIVHEIEEEKDPNITIWHKEKKRPEILIPDGKSLPEALLNSCKRMGKSLACADNLSGVLSYPQLKMRAILLAKQFCKIEGDHIGILLPATVTANVVIFATLLAGKIPVMINWTVGSTHLKHVQEASKIQHIITSWRFLDGLENADLGDIGDKLITLEEIRDNLHFSDKIKALLLSKRSTSSILSHFKIDSQDPNLPAALLFTSGTESQPKGVPLSHKNILSNLTDALKTLHFPSDSTILAALPPFHSFGFSLTGLLPLISGMKVAYFPDPTNSSALARSIEKWGATLFCAPPSFLKALLKTASSKQLDSLRLILSGAERAPEELFHKISSLGKSFIEGYGITECSPILTVNREKEPHIGVGKPLPSIKILIVHPETHQILPQGERGLIIAHGPNIFNGYLNQKNASPFLQINGKKWYNTGDLGFLDEENNLTISGRLKRFVKIGGEMISLGAIEDALLQTAHEKQWSLPEEGAAFVVCSLEIPGEKPELILLTRSFLTLRDANEALKERGLSNLSRISSIRQVEEIPITGTGKVNYRYLDNYIAKEFTSV